MRVAALMVAMLLSGCAQMAAQQAATNAAACLNEVKSSPEGQVVSARLWADDTDNANKLSDPNPLTKSERDALVRLDNKLRRCRQIIIEHDNRFAAWEPPYWQEFFQRTDAIHLKLATGEIAVGVANKLIIESVGKFQTDVSKGHAQAVSIEEKRRQRASEALLQASAQILASQPTTQMTTTNCQWLGNNLNCTSIGR